MRDQINEELKLLDKQNKVSLIVDLYHSVKFFMNTNHIKVCSLFLYDDKMFGEPFETREELLIEYTSNNKKIKNDFNLAMQDVGLNHININYIAPCFKIQDFLKTVKHPALKDEASSVVYV